MNLKIVLNSGCEGSPCGESHRKNRSLLAVKGLKMVYMHATKLALTPHWGYKRTLPLPQGMLALTSIEPGPVGRRVIAHHCTNLAPSQNCSIMNKLTLSYYGKTN